MSDASKWLIWSHKHNAWWLASRYGYTTDLADAGRFTDEESEQIAAKASLGRWNGMPYSVRIPADSANHAKATAEETARVLAAKAGSL